MSETVLNVLVAVGIVVGLIGVVVPYLPGLLLSWGSVVAWAIFADVGPARWWVLGAATVLALGGTLAKFLFAGRHLARSGVPGLTIFVGTVLAIVGFFVIPVVGLIVGFIGGVFLAEAVRLKGVKVAWPSTWTAVKAVGLGILIELGAGLLILVSWAAGAFFG